MNDELDDASKQATEHKQIWREPGDLESELATHDFVKVFYEAQSKPSEEDEA